MIRPTKLEITQVADRADVTLSIEGELDMHTIGELSARVDGALDAGAQELTLDLRRLDFMDSSGIRLLIQLYDRSRQDGWRLMLVAPDQYGAALVLRATGADRALPFVEAREP